MSIHEFAKYAPENTPLTVETESKFLKLRLQIQADFMREYGDEIVRKKNIKPEDDTTLFRDDIYMEWAEKYSKKFGGIFHRLIISNPHLLEDITNIPDAIYEEIKLELYHDDEKVVPDEYIDEEGMKEAA